MAVSASIPKGTRDFLPRDVWRREHVIGVIRRVYEAHGFEPLETPAIENIETLTGKYGEEGDQLLFKILKRGAKASSGECDLGLRYDLTVPLARVVAMHQGSLPRFLKRYQIQPVWRADRPARGRFREFYQCDVDIVGSASALVEVDLLGAIAEVFEALGFGGATIKLNDRRILRGLVEASGVPLAQELDAVTAIDKLDKVGAEGVRAEFVKRGIEAAAGDALLALLADLAGLPQQDALARMEAAFEGRADALAGVAGLREILSGLEAAGTGGVQVQVDPYLARGMSYYTGAIFEVTTPDLGGSLGGGGRYDKLIGMFKGQDVPACGASLGLERLLLVMEERGMFPPHQGGSDVMVAYFSPQTVGAGLGLAGALRRAGVRVDLYPQKDKLGKQFEYANSRGVRLVAVIGPDEQAAQLVKLKDMVSGEQVTVPQAEAAAFVRGRLSGGA